MKQKFNDYYLGLDIGTNSVGWAVTNTEYELLKFNKKWMHGVRLFDAMDTAQDRRMFRSARRRNNRKKDRINTLQEYFSNEINKVDPDFFVRLKESFLHVEDKSTKSKYVLFSDDNFKDYDYYEEYKSIYHLRYDLMNTNEYRDIRLVYLAIHHILKNRGNFLYEGNMTVSNNIEHLIELLNELTEQLFGQEIYVDIDYQKYIDVLSNVKLNKTNRTTELNNFLDDNIDLDLLNVFKEIHKLISARKVALDKIYTQIDLDGLSIQLDDSNINDKIDEITGLDDAQLRLIELVKEIYDLSILKNILKDHTSISEAMLSSYNKHKDDLKELKSLIKPFGKNEYFDVFENENSDNNYVAYIGKSKKSNTKSTATQEEFYKFISKKIKNLEIDSNVINKIEEEMSVGEYLPKQRISSNGVIPHQLHLYELICILENAKEHHNFLNEKDESNLTVADRIIEIFKFKIPYYIGPLNDHHTEDNGGFSWVVRRKRGKVYPWNFNEMIDVDKTAEKFIRRMTNSCTYLVGEDVVPKSSLVYQKFMVLNELNNLKVNGESISVSLKQKIYQDLFLDKSSIVSKKRIEAWLKANEPDFIDLDIDITGIDNTMTTKMSTYHRIKDIFGDKVPEDSVIEDLILWNTIFNDAKDILEDRIKKVYGNILTEEQIKQVVKANFVGWGNLSKQFLEGLVDGEGNNIITMLYESNHNLMELLSSKFIFGKLIEEHNETKLKRDTKVAYTQMETLNIPPNVKRSVWQTLRITEEIKRVTGRDPKRIFIEMARGTTIKTGRTSSRKEQLKAFYNAINADPELKESLESQTDDTLRKRSIYLYYRQLGKCMYTGSVINFGKLVSGSHDYDLDHIYPQSLTADDSLNNLVLVTKKANEYKSDSFLHELDGLQERNKPFWNYLYQAGLIEREKYQRLTRKTPLSAEELSGFVARQLVETRQSTKAVLHLLKQLYPKTEVITVKAHHVNKFRHENEIVKVRFINDLHHAKDAYLSIVVGNVYYERFTADPRNYIRNSKRRDYNLTRVIETKRPGFNVFSRSTGELVWESGVKGTIKTVKDVLSNNAILTTRLTQERSGGLFDQNPTKKAKNRISLKDGMDPEKYGGFNKPTYTYNVLIERLQGKRLIRSLEPVPLHIEQKIADKDDLLFYFTNELNYKDVKILMNRIPAFNTLLEIDGSRNRITGVTGNSFYLRNEHQPYFNDEKITNTLKVIEKIIEYGRDDLIDSLPKENVDEVITRIVDKMKLSIHRKRLNTFIKLIESKQETIRNLNNAESINLAVELMKLIRSTRETSNLKLIGGASKSGVNKVGKNLSNRQSIYLINQSVTGLFENKIDLLKI